MNFHNRKCFVFFSLLIAQNVLSESFEECLAAINIAQEVSSLIPSLTPERHTSGTYFLYALYKGYIFEHRMGVFESKLLYMVQPKTTSKTNVFITWQGIEDHFLEFLSLQIDLSLHLHLYCSSDSGYSLTFCCIYSANQRDRTQIYKAFPQPYHYGVYGIGVK